MTTDPNDRFTPAELADLDSRAVQLVAIAHGEGSAGDVARLTANLDRQQLIGLAISCAAMVDPDKSVAELLAWMNADDPRQGWTDEELRRAHARYTRGVRDEHTVQGERIYQKISKRRQRTAPSTGLEVVA
ncbi:hypothetical protein IM25_22785 [Rhodococcus sp. p52]|uniref:hypothetical protein n=1 Tax=Rhodococcus sp. p52 TaxID=935199 RepID=UPI00051A002E|nr:hypothetical protein [Rhodococcus sp. p52]AOD24058.1 hypothetical protein IM25_22785 [Rhodococcus sp. p52]